MLDIKGLDNAEPSVESARNTSPVDASDQAAQKTVFHADPNSEQSCATVAKVDSSAARKYVIHVNPNSEQASAVASVENCVSTVAVVAPVRRHAISAEPVAVAPVDSQDATTIADVAHFGAVGSLRDFNGKARSFRLDSSSNENGAVVLVASHETQTIARPSFDPAKALSGITSIAPPQDVTILNLKRISYGGVRWL